MNIEMLARVFHSADSVSDIAGHLRERLFKEDLDLNCTASWSMLTEEEQQELLWVAAKVRQAIRDGKVD